MEASTGKSRGPATLAAGIIAGVLLAIGITGSIVYGVRGASDTLTTSALWTNNGDPLISDTQREKAIAVADQFCLRMDNLDGSDPDGYTKRVKQLLTTKLKAAFDEQFDAVQKLQTDTSVKGQGTILASGISDIDPDSATVLVAHDTLVTSASGNVQRHARWTVTLRKIDGRWLVDNWDPAS
jgi:hypothetical protein